MGWSKYSEDNDGFSEERLTNTYGAGKYSYNFNHYWTSETAKASDWLRHLRNQPHRNPFVEVNHQRVKLATEQFSKITLEITPASRHTETIRSISSLIYL